jgi:hypothetical protein
MQSCLQRQLEAASMAVYEMVFRDLLQYGPLVGSGYCLSKLERDENVGIYRLQIAGFATPNSTLEFTVFDDQFKESVANGRLSETIVREIKGAIEDRRFQIGKGSRRKH